MPDGGLVSAVAAMGMDQKRGVGGSVPPVPATAEQTDDMRKSSSSCKNNNITPDPFRDE